MKHIMVVDDDEQFLDEIDEMLISSGYKTTPLSESRYAVMIACMLRPEVILLDLKMDEVNGFKIAVELRNSPEAVAAKPAERH